MSTESRRLISIISFADLKTTPAAMAKVTREKAQFRSLFALVARTENRIRRKAWSLNRHSRLRRLWSNSLPTAPRFRIPQRSLGSRTASNHSTTQMKSLHHRHPRFPIHLQKPDRVF